MSSRLLTSAFSARACARSAPRDARRCVAGGVGQRLQRFGQRDQRGERRAHVVRDARRAARCAAAPIPSRPPPAAPRRRSARAPARSRSGAPGVELLRLLGDQQPARLRRLERQHAAHAHRRLQRHVVPGLRRQRGGGEAGRLALAKAQSATLASKPGGARRRRDREAVVRVGHQHHARGRRNGAAPRPRRVSTTCALERAPDSSRASSNSDCARRSRLVDTRGPKRRPGGELADQQADAEHHGEGHAGTARRRPRTRGAAARRRNRRPPR